MHTIIAPSSPPATTPTASAAVGLWHAPMSHFSHLSGMGLIGALMHYWSFKEHGWRAAHAPKPLTHTADGDLCFENCPKGIPAYIFSYHEGETILVSRVFAEHVVDRATAVKMLNTTNLWPEEWHIIGRGANERWDRIVPPSVLMQLESIGGNRPTPNPASGRIHHMSIVTPRFLKPSAVPALELLLEQQP
jgi:hypothetical protein